MEGFFIQVVHDRVSAEGWGYAYHSEKGKGNKENYI